MAANRYQFQVMERPFVFSSWGDGRPAGRLVFAEPDHDQALWIVEPAEPAIPAPV